MSGIPSLLLNSLRIALCECDEFKDSKQLYLIFESEELSPWKSGISIKDNVTSNVDSLIGYLLNKERISGENALILFIKILASRYDPKDSRQDQLLLLANNLEWTLKLPCYEGANKLESNPLHVPMLGIVEVEKLYESAQSVSRIEIPDSKNGKNIISMGTAWLIAPTLAITCGHVFGIAKSSYVCENINYMIKNTCLTFDFITSGRGVQYSIENIEYPRSFPYSMDYAILRLKDRSDRPLNKRGYLSLDSEAPLTPSTSLYIIQHPLGQPQQCTGDNFIKYSKNYRNILYRTPTEPGTSGAPVFNRLNWRVAAIHQGENSTEKLREGILIKSILSDLEEGSPLIFKEIIQAQKELA